MRKKLLKTMSLIVAVFIFATILPACNVEEGLTESEIESTESKNETASEPAWKTEIVNLVIWDYPVEGPTKESTLKRFEEFELEYPNIKIEHKLFQPEPGKDRIEFAIAMAGGTGPDMYPSVPFVTIKPWIKQGFAYPLNEYLDNWEFTKDLQQGPLQMATEDGKVFGIPIMMTPITFAYRTDLYEEAGLDPSRPPRTWEEYVEYAKALTKDDGSQYGISLLGGDIADWWFMYYVWQAGGEITSIQDDGTVKLHITEKPTVDALQFYKDLKWTHKVVQADMMMPFGDMANEFATGRSAQMLFAPEWLPWFSSMGLKQEQMAIAPLPKGPSGKGTTSISGVLTIFNPNTDKDKRDATWEYFKFMYSKENEINKLKELQEANVTYPIIPMYKDILVSDYMQVPDSWTQAANDALNEGREEYYLVESIRPYLVKAIQKVLVDKDADPKAALEEVAEEIQREVIDKYNSDLNK